MDIDYLIPTQSGLRDYDLLTHLIKHVKAGRLFYQIDNKPLIQIVEFEDGFKYIRDGHHRIAAKYIAGWSFLDDTEYQITKMTYNMFETINFDAGWVTPFDPRIEVRRPDFFTFKKAIISLNELNQEDLMYMLMERRNLYIEKRFQYSDIPKFKHIRELV